jgi:hypothetical protein
MKDGVEMPIKINVKHKGAVTTIETDVKDSVLLLRDKVEKAMKVKQEEQRLIFKGHILRDEEIIEETNLKNGDTIELVIIASNPYSIIEVEKAKEEKKNAVNSQMSAGGFGLMNKLGYAPSGNAAIESLLESPYYKQMLDSVLKFVMLDA